MTALSSISVPQLRALQDSIREKIRSARTIDAAAQKATETIYDAFPDSLALARLYVTVPFGRLPLPVQSFARDIATANRVAGTLSDTTPVLSLMGTRGAEADWNDRRRSKGHAGIPLVTTRFVSAIPMLARLLQDMGVGIDWIDSQDLGVIDRMVEGGLAGLFHVEDASTSRDSAGRLIIPAQDFVASQKVRTVFGMGGSYMGGTFASFILFSREEIPRAVAQRFVPLVNVFKSSTTPLAMRSAFFEE